MFATASARVAERCVGREVLAIQDTTVVRSAGGGGEYLHVVLAVDAVDGTIVGLAHACFLRRTQGRRDDRRSRAVEDKESYRWLEGAAHAASVCAGASGLTVVADRESDIYEAFARRPAASDLVIRAAQDRAVEDGARLFAAADALPEAGRTVLSLPARPGRPARSATLAVRFKAVRLQRPKMGRRTDTDPAEVAVHLVDVREVDPPPGQPALHWRLLSTRPVEDLRQALEVVDLYRRRWAIEQLFRTLKSKGFDIEDVDIENPPARTNLVAAALIAATTVQQLVHARDGAAEGPLRPLTDAFDPEDAALLQAFCRNLEGATQRQKNPHPEGSLAYAAWVCARLGGWTGYYGKPGPIVMLNGWLYFQAAKHGALLVPHPDV